MARPDKIVLFDGVCNLCNGLVKFIIRHDRRGVVRFSSLQSHFARTILNEKSLETDSVIYLTEEKALIRSDAILYMFRDMGGLWKLLYGFIVVPKFIRDFFYDLVARNRYRIFGKRETCMVPTPDMKERFLE